MDVDEDGRIYVLDMQAREVRVFGSDGEYLRTIGRPGSGPGEFSAATILVVATNNAVLVADLINRRVHRFSPEGTVNGGFDLVGGTSQSKAWDLAPNGDLLEHHRGAITLVNGGMAMAEDVLIRRDSTGAIRDTVFVLPADETARMVNGALAPRMFGSQSLWALAHGNLLVSDGTQARIEVRSLAGELTRVIALDAATGPSETTAAGAAPSGIGRRERWIWASLAMIGLAIAAGVAWRSIPKPEVALPVTRFGVLPPGDGVFTGNPPRFAISPDGQSLVFAATLEPGKPEQFWLRRLDSMEVTPVPGTEGGSAGIMPQAPFWSPDGRHLAFFVQTERVGAAGESRLRTVDLQGGTVQTVCDLPSNNAGGSWNGDGVMLVSSQESKGIQRVPASGGVPTPVTTLDESRNEVAHRFPQFLPDGRHFIYQVQTTDRSGWSIVAGSIDSPETTLLVQSEYARFAAPNVLLFAREANLFAQSMDMATRTLTGDPVKVASGVYSLSTNGRAGFAASDNGVLVYRSNPEQVQASAAPNRQLTWIDRTGKPVGIPGIPTSSSRLRLSPTADRVALLEFSPSRPSLTIGTLWVADLGRGVKAPLTSGSTHALSPTWSARGERVLFGIWPDSGDVTMHEQVASGATPASPLHQQAGLNVSPIGESTDGNLVLFTSGKVGVRNLQVFSRSTGASSTYLANGFDHPQASLSPDGKWLAYVSNESSAYEIVVQPFPDPSLGKWPISTNGGVHPRWRHDGRELFYVDSDERLVAVPVAAGRDFVPGKPTPLFTLPIGPEINVFGAAYVYDVAPGGQRFLISVQSTGVAQRVPLIVTTNWTSLLKK
jgi:Tol biopolymer transport system component